MGPTGGWAGDGGGGNSGFGDNYSGVNRVHHNGHRHPNLPYGSYRPDGPPPPGQERRPAWQRDGRPDTRLPPRPPPTTNPVNWGGSYDGSRSERPEYRDRDRERALPRSRAGVGGVPGGPRDVDTYIPSYGPESGRREDRPRDDRRRWDDRDERRHDRDRDRLDYDDRGRNGRTRSRSRSPVRERERDRVRERDPLSRERDVYRR
jgi:serine/threonine-protein kinase BUR1